MLFLKYRLVLTAATLKTEVFNWWYVDHWWSVKVFHVVPGWTSCNHAMNYLWSLDQHLRSSILNDLLT